MGAGLNGVVSIDANSDRGKSRWLGLIPVAIAFVLMAWISWRKWPEILVDFSRQLYVPWRLAEGDVFGRDVAYLSGGPFSQYFNALLFKIFGVSYATLFAFDLLLTAILVFYVYALFLRSSNRLTATMVSLTIVLGFAFAQYFKQGSYNYISPYVHEVVHGLFLNILLIGCLSNWLENGARKMLLASGFCFGLIFLTKPETFLAAVGVSAACFLMMLKKGGMRKFFWSSIGTFLLAGLVAPGTFFLYFLQHCSVSDSIRYVGWAWVPLLTSDVTKNSFYQWCLGFDMPRARAKASLMQFLYTSAVILFVWIRCRAKKFYPGEKWLWAGAACLIAGAYDWTKAGRSLPLFALGAFVIFLWHNWRKDWGQKEFSVPFLWIVLSLFFLAKMGLHSRLYHYGFALAMPAFVSAVFLVVWLLPEVMKQVRGRYDVFRFVMVVFLVTGLFRLAETSWHFYQKKTFPVGSGSDLFLAEPQQPETPQIAAAAEWLAREIPPGKTVAAVPEGSMLNYLARRANSTPYVVFAAEVQAFGEEAMFSAYRKAPPDFVLLLHCEKVEHAPSFYPEKKEFGLAFVEWIGTEYQTHHIIGQTNSFAIEVMKRK